MRRAFIFLLVVFPAVVAMATPPEIPGEVVYIPFPVQIGTDGMPDWNSLPSYTVDTGPNLSSDPAENGSFSFALASDGESLFLRFTMKDLNIVAGRHGGEYWNEDSLEFYINDSGDLNAKVYGPGVFQVNVNATGIDSGELPLTGVRLEVEDPELWGRSFRTDDGWGFEAALSLAGRPRPVHGGAFGFQAQANGATADARDVKLIWSVFDTDDKSWKSPSLFGSALWFEIGSDDVPPPPDRNAPAAARIVVPVEDRSGIRINQHAYPQAGRKIAVALMDDADPVDWTLVDDYDGRILASGMTEPYGRDVMSGQNLHWIDFSSFEGQGALMELRAGEMQSPPVFVGADPYGSLAGDSLSYFYRSRAGIALDPELAGSEWSRSAWYSSDSAVIPFSGSDFNGVERSGGDYVLDAGGGWFDAGDYGKYVVNGALAAWTLGNLYERDSEFWPDGSLPIPESDNGIPDLLDELRWEMDFLLGMQIPRGEDSAGMVHHKLHETEWHPFPMLGHDEAVNRYVYEPSTAATYDMAAVAAQFSRLIKPYDRMYSRRCLNAAKAAWKAAERNPVFTYGDIPGSGGGNYDDTRLDDERFLAAVELYLSTGAGTYLKAIEEFLNSDGWRRDIADLDGTLSWQRVSLAGAVSLMSHPVRRGSDDVRQMAAEGLMEAAEGYLRVAETDGYRVPMTGYPWGSNSAVLNKAIIMAVAGEWMHETGDDESADNLELMALESLDYLLGRNAIAQSYITGYGLHSTGAPHHRFWAAEPDFGFPAPPPGVLAGGPNASPRSDDPASVTVSEAMAARYLDHNGSFSTNEVAINWNAPLAWMAHWAGNR